ncbi:MAG: hypothetical protein AB7E32_16890 [Desulfovibrio sp.]
MSQAIPKRVREMLRRLAVADQQHLDEAARLLIGPELLARIRACPHRLAARSAREGLVVPSQRLVDGAGGSASGPSRDERARCDARGVAQR